MAVEWKYLPILKWKQGERIALQNLSGSQWEKIVPLLELQAIAAAPDAGALRVALPGYMEKIAKELGTAVTGDKFVAIDIRHVSPAYPKQIRLLKAVCAFLANQAKRQIIPVLTESMVADQTGDLTVIDGFSNYILRIHTPSMDATQLTALVELTRANGIRKSALHVVVDQYSMVNQDPVTRFTAVRPFIDAALGTECRSITVAGGSFPANLIGLTQGIHDLPRVEWKVWETVRVHSDYDELRYSDYAVTNPAPLPDLDPKQINPSVAIRYAAADFWRLFKAGGFKKGKPNQYRALCQLLLGDPVYTGSSFSYGDSCYEKAADARLGNGNPSSWRRDATSHHLVLTASAL